MNKGHLIIIKLNNMYEYGRAHGQGKAAGMARCFYLPILDSSY